MSSSPQPQPQPVTVMAYQRRLIAPVRAYLALPCALRHLIGAGLLLFFPDVFPNEHLIPVIGVFPLPLWALFFGLTGLFALVGAGLNNRPLARVALIASGSLTLAVGGGILLGTAVLAHLGGHPMQTPYPQLAVWVLSLAAADYCVLAGHWVPMTREDPT